MRIKFVTLTLFALLALAACGETRGQRIVTGAAGGAVAGEIIDEKPLEGAAIGGLIGAVR